MVAAVVYAVDTAFSWEDFYSVCTAFHRADSEPQNCRNLAWQKPGAA